MQPVELARKLAKEMDDHKTISIHRVYVPDEYTIYLNPADREQFAAYETQMRNELAEYLVEHARREGYSLSARPLVLLETEQDLTVGTFGIAVSTQSPAVRAEAAAVPAEPAAEPPPAAAPGPADRRWMRRRGAAADRPQRDHDLRPRRRRRQRARGAGGGGTAETATLEWAGGIITIDQRVVVIGRSSDCEIRVDDANVSRRHAEVRRIGDGYSLVDLGSTNGTEVNGQRIQETALMSGDVIAVGTTRITFERRLG